eukprot:c9567_g1_i1.p1 GENE.c9567_g1_i1~~c9567_g1_i1.p1  ORF type:complete len:133 (-),score=32.48 c9567_g1_i1:16-414(-)
MYTRVCFETRTIIRFHLKPEIAQFDFDCAPQGPMFQEYSVRPSLRNFQSKKEHPIFGVEIGFFSCRLLGVTFCTNGVWENSNSNLISKFFQIGLTLYNNRLRMFGVRKINFNFLRFFRNVRGSKTKTILLYE